MSLSKCKREIQSFLQKQQLKACNVVVLPDFFLDRIINLEWDASEFSRLVADVTKRKGGSIDGISQTDLRGGNAINVGSALASLGAEVTPIVSTNQFGLQQIKYHFRNSSIDTSHINVMIRDLGALADFGPANLTEGDYSLIEASDYVCLFNWAGTLKFGTALAQTIFDRVKQKGKGKTYYDTADPNPNATAISDLMEKVLKTDKVDILSLNENEAITFANLLDVGLKEEQANLGFTELAMDSARVLANLLPARIDLHTTAFSATFKGKKEVVVPAFKVKVFRATGAGDSWDAGNILGDHNGLSDESRLMLANAVAACYLSDPDGLHPTKEKLFSFLRDYV
jgi:sugar/nucleoside kinase (ribokinase family)